MKILQSILFAQKMLAALCLFVLSVFVSCSKDPSPQVQLNTPQLDLNYDQQHQFTISEGAVALNPQTFSWTSDDQTVGTVDTDGKFKARKVGKTVVRAVSQDGKTWVESKVTVVPYSLLFSEPVVLWGAKQALVQAEEKRKISESTRYYLAFTGETEHVKKADYYFTEDQKLSHANIFLENDSETYQQAVLYLTERYPDNFSSNNTVAPFQLIHSFFNEDRTTLIYFSKTEVGNLVSYHNSVE